MARPILQDDLVVWGDLQLHGPADPDVDYDIAAYSAGSNFGNPVSIVDTLQSLAIDGVLAARTGWDARTIVLQLYVDANDGETHAEVEAALTSQCLPDRPPPIVWTPPLANSAPAVFDVLVAELERDTSDGWDSDEVLQGRRVFTLTLTCLPFARTADTEVVPAIAPPPDPGAAAVVTVLDDCSSVTHWTIQASSDFIHASGPTVEGTPAFLTAEAGTITAGTQYLRMVRTAALTMPSGQPYLVVDISTLEANGSGKLVTIPGTYVISADNGTGPTLQPLLVQPGVGIGGSDRVFFQPPASFSSLRIRKDYLDSWSASKSAGYSIALEVHRVASTDTLGDTTTSTTRQGARQATIVGSMPTRATIRLYHSATSSSLGRNLLIFTSANTDWTPPLRCWRTSSDAVTADTSRVSGGTNPLAGPMKFLIPASLLASGTYSLMASLHVTSAATIAWQARLVAADGSDTIGSSQILSGTTSLAASSIYTVYNLADRLQLPPIEVETDDYAVEITLQATAGAATIDEGWLFGLDNGALTWISNLSNDPIAWVEVRSPDLGAARPSVFGGSGNVDEQSMCLDWACESFGSHRFEPGPLLVFTMTMGSLIAQCELEYFPRFHSHPAASALSEDDSTEAG
ncbi:MAG: hypothetical protein FWD95_01780 [Nocardioidaceae bacterium]|nr:hypothetical protein [Nocardioidaceae bacterium]